MSDIIATIIQDFIIFNLNYLGAAIKWLFLRKKYTYKELLKQDWNTRIGALTFIILISLVIITIA